MLNLYPPLLFNRIRILGFDHDFRSCRVRVARSLLTRNLNGTTFGGTIFSAADPFYAVMFWQIFAHRGERVQAWLRTATIRYQRPAATALTLDFRLSDADVNEATEQLDREGRFVRSFRTAAVDHNEEVCAEIETEVYLRRPRGDQPEVSAF
jgi:acyl-coenzyme A thioesterase PaaI-like protein